MLPGILLLAVVFGILWWRGRHPYILTRAEMKDALRRVLEGKMPDHEWLKLVHTPITRDSYLEALRVRLAELPRKTRIETSGALFEPQMMQEISSRLNELVQKRE